MKTPEEIINWCDVMLSHHPNMEDVNYFNAIKYYMREEISRGALAHTCTVYLDEFRESKG